MGEKILGYLARADGIIFPELADSNELTGGKKFRFDSKDVEPVLRQWAFGKFPLGIRAERRRPLKVFFNVSATDFLMFDHLGLFICLDEHGRFDPNRARVFAEKIGVQKVLDVAKGFYNVTSANWGYVRNDFYERDIGDALDKEGNLIGNTPPKVKWALPGLYWANFFGPEYVEMFGREKVLVAPCHRLERLPDGGVLILLSESPFDANSDDYEARKQELYAYLGEDAFTGRLMPKFRTVGRKKRDARPLVETGGIRDDIFH